MNIHGKGFARLVTFAFLALVFVAGNAQVTWTWLTS
jgi:hypothetical protein